jgi:triacylglycerol lipase
MRDRIGAERVAGRSGVRRPSMLDALGELRVPLEATILWLHAWTYPWPRVSAGRAKTVMLIPGFMAGDITLGPMANFLRMLGHKPAASGIWSNSDCPRKMLDLLSARIERVAERHGSPMVLIGHSLGGVYAREIARRFPDYVERVITMGSPIRRPRHAANLAVQAVANSVARIRGEGEGCLSENCAKCGLTMSAEPPPEVPVTVIYSRTDGIVHWESCFDDSGSALVENVEVMCSHVGMAINAEVYKVIADRLLLAPPARFSDESAPSDASPS